MRSNLKLVVNNPHNKIEEKHFFEKDELKIILDLYAKMVSEGSWKDYGLSISSKQVGFSVFRNATENALYKICKNFKPKNKNLKYLITDTSGKILKNSHDLRNLLKTNKSLVDKKYNLIVSLGSRSSGGYKLEFNKIKNKNKKTYVYFNEIKPPKNSKNIAVISYPFCILKIDNLNEYKIKIKKKRSKFFPFSIFH